MKSSRVFEKAKFAEVNNGLFVLFFGMIALFGFLMLLMPLKQLAGNVIGEVRGNLYGIFFLLSFLICWSAIVVFWNLKDKIKEEVNVKKLIKSG
jgi:hypothetical protein